VQPGSEQTNTSAHLCTRGEGVAKRWAVFVYICYNPPLLTVEEAQEVLSHSFPRSFDEEDFICTEEARKLLVEAGVDKAFKSAIEFTKSCNESQLPMNAKTFKSWLGHELRKPY
jgi:hypothetical protein